MAGAERCAGVFLVIDRGQIEIEEAVFRIENLQVPADRAAGLAQNLPVQSPDLRGQPFARGFFRIEPEKPAGRMVDEFDHPLRIENDDSFLQGFEDFLEEAFFADQAGDDLLDLTVFDAVQAGDEFFEETGFHGNSDKCAVIGYQEEVSAIRIILCTFPQVELARQIGTALVEKQLAACVNLIPSVESVYRWQGHVESATEVLAVFKTSAALLPAFQQALTDLHPYEVPEIVALEPAAVADTYQAWLLGQLAGE